MGRTLLETLMRADALIPPGGEIKMTQSSVDLAGLPGKVIYNIGGAGKGAGG